MIIAMTNIICNVEHISHCHTTIKILRDKVKERKISFWDVIEVVYNFICDYLSLPSNHIYLFSSHIIAHSLDFSYLLLDHPLLITTPP